ncbi:unnamed protein product [Paramecium octaurelia]|uniref:Uncharacterized protein n=1 Tax=Paramecium octaurelia TaxID=43137 RepID=A0A8S1TG92_PAROT|nr:unnamed protein product [Paramecium octaurelia]
MGICFGILDEDKQEDRKKNPNPIQQQLSEEEKEEEITYQLQNFTYKDVQTRSKKYYYRNRSKRNSILQQKSFTKRNQKIMILQYTKSPFIITLYSTLVNNNKLQMSTEFVNDGDLLLHLKNISSSEKKGQYFMQLNLFQHCNICKKIQLYIEI